MDHLVRLIGRYGERIEEALGPFAAALARLVTIPGVDFRVAEVVVAEIGLDMGRFPTAGHLSSWAGLASGNHKSAGRRRTGRTTPGNSWLKAALVQASWAAYPTRATHLSGKFRRIAGSRGKKRAAVAVAHTILVIIYHVPKEEPTYQESAGDSAVA
jgi:transposase